jgi:hypothetical protein
MGVVRMYHAFIKIDLLALRARLSREQRREVDPAEVTQWLVQGGFTSNDDWYCNHQAIPQLRQNEILSRRDL